MGEGSEAYGDAGVIDLLYEMKCKMIWVRAVLGAHLFVGFRERGV